MERGDSEEGREELIVGRGVHKVLACTKPSRAEDTVMQFACTIVSLLSQRCLVDMNHEFRYTAVYTISAAVTRSGEAME
jgi:hypothetical protein